MKKDRFDQLPKLLCLAAVFWAGLFAQCASAQSIAGTYKGSYSGADNGSVTITVDSLNSARCEFDSAVTGTHAVFYGTSNSTANVSIISCVGTTSDSSIWSAVGGSKSPGVTTIQGSWHHEYIPSGGLDSGAFVASYTASTGGGTGPISLGGYMSGNWYNPTPGQSGQGFELEFTGQANTVVAYWFVYSPDGKSQNWIYAQGTYDTSKNTVTLPAIIQTGAMFPPNFNSSQLTQTPWGTVTFTFSDCNDGTASWNSTVPGYGSGSFPIVRLTSIGGMSCP